MRTPRVLLFIIPGWTLAYFKPVPLSRSAAAPRAAKSVPSSSSTVRSRFSDTGVVDQTRGRCERSTHGSRCGPLFRKGFSKGGMGKQSELMELMAKAKQDRAKKELEERLRESGDLPEENAKPVKSKRGTIKAERSWRDGGATSTAAGGEAVSPVASGQTAEAGVEQAEGAAKAGQGTKRQIVDPGGIGSRVWSSTQIEGRPNDAYFDYDQLLEGTEDHGGARVSPDLENPQASYAQYDELRGKAEWEAVVAGKPSVANRSPVASESEYDNFESMLTHGTPRTSRKGGEGVVSPKVLEKRVNREIERKVQQGFSAGEFAPLDPWRALSDAEGEKTNFGLYRGTKPLLVVADPRPGSSEMREAVNELNMRMPRKLVDVVAVTADSPGANRKTAKKSRISFPMLADDESGTWMLAYRLRSPSRLAEKTAFLIEPDLGTLLQVWTEFDAVSLVDLVKEFVKGE